MTLTSPGPRLGSKSQCNIKRSCDKHLLAAAHDSITVGPVLAVLKAMLVLSKHLRRFYIAVLYCTLTSIHVYLFRHSFLMTGSLQVIFEIAHFSSIRNYLQYLVHDKKYFRQWGPLKLCKIFSHANKSKCTVNHMLWVIKKEVCGIFSGSCLRDWNCSKFL
jgi:hypothetical protein